MGMNNMPNFCGTHIKQKNPIFYVIYRACHRIHLILYFGEVFFCLQIICTSTCKNLHQLWRGKMIKMIKMISLLYIEKIPEKVWRIFLLICFKKDGSVLSFTCRHDLASPLVHLYAGSLTSYLCLNILMDHSFVLNLKFKFNQPKCLRCQFDEYASLASRLTTNLWKIFNTMNTSIDFAT